MPCAWHSYRLSKGSDPVMNLVWVIAESKGGAAWPLCIRLPAAVPQRPGQLGRK